MDTEKKHANEGKQQDNPRVGTDIPHPGTPGKAQNVDQDASSQGHMGAEDGQMKPTKPVTPPSAEPTDKKGHTRVSDHDDYDPQTELTPG
jgi:hypothetical protein